MQPRITLCSICHSQMPAGQSYCNNCGSTLCPRCRELLPQRSRYCPKCGFLSIAEEQSPIIKSVPSAISTRSQAIPIPRIPVPTPQPVAQAAVHQQSFGTPVLQHQRNCPKCGASIDHELGRCSGCGLLYGVNHRLMQSPTAPIVPAPRPNTSWPQSSMEQQPPGAQAMGHQYNNPRPSLPTPSFGQRPNYLSPGIASQGGILMPIPSVAPATAGAMSAGVPMAPRPYQYQSVPSAPAGRNVPALGNRGLVTVVTTLVILIACFLIGSGVYHFLNRTETTPTVNSAINNSLDNSLLRIQDITVQSTGATIKWTTDKPATSSVTITDASGAVITKTQPQSTLETSHSVAVSDLKSNTTYHYKIISTDAAGTPTTSEGKLKTTTPTTVTDDKTAPTISAVSVSNITESSVIVTWMTDEPATSQVRYEKTGKYGSITPIDKNLTTNHIIKIANLDPGATYNCSAISRDPAGNEALSAIKQTFITLAPIPVGSQVGNRAPDFTLKDLSGKDVRLSGFRGKIVMINFWATWCDPCVKELPYIQAVSKEWSNKGVIVLAIAVKTNEQLNSVEQFIRQNRYTFPVLFDSQGQAYSRYGVSTLPATFFVDADGIVKKRQIGSYEDQASIEKILNSLQ